MSDGDHGYNGKGGASGGSILIDTDYFSGVGNIRTTGGRGMQTWLSQSILVD